jgi:hypothetical protein
MAAVKREAMTGQGRRRRGSAARGRNRRLLRKKALSEELFIFRALDDLKAWLDAHVSKSAPMSASPGPKRSRRSLSWSTEP